MVLPETDTGQDNVGIATEVFAEHRDFIHMVIYSQIKNKSHADDIFQEFFISLVSKPIPQNIKSIKSYLYRAICNDIVDSQRQVERYNTQINKYQERCDFSINNTEPGNALIIDEQRNKMFDLIKGRLTSSQSQAIVLRYGTNHTVKEVAEKMGVKRTSVSRYICTGLRRMRQSLK